MKKEINIFFNDWIVFINILIILFILILINAFSIFLFLVVVSPLLILIILYRVIEYLIKRRINE